MRAIKNGDPDKVSATKNMIKKAIKDGKTDRQIMLMLKDKPITKMREFNWEPKTGKVEAHRLKDHNESKKKTSVSARRLHGYATTREHPRRQRFQNVNPKYIGKLGDMVSKTVLTAVMLLVIFLFHFVMMAFW